MPDPTDKKKKSSNSKQKNVYEERAQKALQRVNVPLADNSNGNKQSNNDNGSLTWRQQAGLDPVNAQSDVATKEKPSESDFGFTSFDEGFEAGYKGLKAGAIKFAGEAAGLIGADQTEEEWSRWAENVQGDAPKNDDSWGFFLGSMTPSIVPTAAAIAASPLTAGTSLSAVPGTLAIGGLSASSAGNGMMEYEAYQKEKGREVNPLALWGVGAAYGGFEAVAERIQLGKLLPNGVSGTIFKGNVEAAEEAGKDLLEKFAKNSPSEFKRLRNKFLQAGNLEGMEEVATETGQTATRLLYEDNEDRTQTLRQLPQNIGMAYLGGSIMGSALGPLSYAAQNKVNRDRREKQGRVIIAENKADGQGYELIAPIKNDQFEGYQALSKDGEETLIARTDVGEVAQLTPEQFDKLLQDKMDRQEFERSQRQAVTIATYNGQQVQPKPDGEGGFYIKVFDDQQNIKTINVAEDELQEIQQVPVEEQMAAEGKPVVNQPTGPVEAIRSEQQEQAANDEPVQTLLQNDEGDFFYPGDEGYDALYQQLQQDEANEPTTGASPASSSPATAPAQPQQTAASTNAEPAAPPSEITVGDGEDVQSVMLQRQQDGSFTVVGRRRMQNGQEQRDATETMSGKQIAALREELQTEYDGDNFDVVTGREDPMDPTSPKTLRVVPVNEQSEEQANQPTGLSGAVNTQEPTDVSTEAVQQSPVDTETGIATEPNVFEEQQTVAETETPQVGSFNQEFNESPKIYGRSEQFTLPTDEEHETQFAVVPLSSIKASHQADTFNETEGFPTSPTGESANSRDYKNDIDAQQTVSRIATNLNGKIFQDLPIISTDGIVVSGNNRTMSLKRVMNAGGRRAQWYSEELKNRAESYGIDPSAIDAVENPVLVRIDKQVPDYAPSTFDAYNKEEKKQQSDVERSITIGKTITDDTLNRLVGIINPEENGTIRAALDRPATGRQAIQLLVDQGVINEMETATYYNQKNGAISSRGKDLVEMVALGAILEPQALRNTSVAGVRSFANKITYALPTLLEIKALGANYDLTQTLSGAVNLQRQIIEQELTPRDAYAQQGLFEDSEVPATVKFYHYLLDSGRNRFKEAVQIYARSARRSSGGQSMFENTQRTRAEITQDLYNYAEEQASQEQQQTLQTIQQTGSNNAGRTTDRGRAQPTSPESNTGQPATQNVERRSTQQQTERGRQRINDLLEGRDVPPLENDAGFNQSDSVNGSEINDIRFSRRKGSAASFERQQLEQQLQQAQQEYRAAQTAFRNKQRELQGTLDADRENLFGERQNTLQNALFDMRADPEQVEKTLKPFRDRREVAKQQVNRLAKKLEQLEDSPDPGLFDEVRFSRMGSEYGRVIPRDFFNESKLITMYSRFADFYNRGKLPDGFEIVRNSDEFGAALSENGEMYSNSVEVYYNGEPAFLSMPYNAGKDWRFPLMITVEGEDIWDISVFEEDGELDSEFTDSFGEPSGTAHGSDLADTFMGEANFLKQMGVVGLWHVDRFLPKNFEFDVIDFESGFQIEENENGLYAGNVMAEYQGQEVKFYIPTGETALHFDYGDISAEVFGDGRDMSDEFRNAFLDDVRFKKQAAPAFYSRLERVVTENMDNKGTPESFAATLQAWNRKGNFKTEELEWSGVIGWLNELDADSVTRDQVLEYLQANQIEIQEVMKGEPGGSLLKEKIAQEMIDNGATEFQANYLLDSLATDYNTENFTAVSEWLNEYTDSSIIDDYVDDTERSRDDTKYPDYTLPGGENYRELLLTLPKEGRGRFEELNDQYNDLIKRRDQLEYGTPKREELSNQLEELAQELEQEAKGLENDFDSSHYDQPNILAHVRFNERTDSDGNRVLFLEEIQSDWHQAGREKGYKGQLSDEQRERIASIETQITEISNELESKYSKVRSKISDFSERSKRIDEIKASNQELIQERESLKNERDSLTGANAVPDAPFKTTWQELIVKRMLRYGAENGFDKVAWTPADVQQDRYDLRKQVEEIRTAKLNDGRYDVLVTTIDGKDINLGMLSENELSDNIGKELAEKVIDDSQNETNNSYSGVDLAVGGEGMEAFYNQIIPRFVSKYTKKWGAEVAPTDIKTDESTKKTLAVNITSQMKDAVLNEGQPLFKRTATQTADFVPDSRPTPEAEQIRTGIEAQIEGWAARDRVQVVSHPSQLPVRIQNRLRQENGRIGGFFVGGKAYVLAYNLNDAAEAESVLTHEAIGHLGIQGLIQQISDSPQEFQERFQGLANEVYDSFKEDALFKQIVKQYGLDMRRNNHKQEAAEEFIAHMAERGEQPGIVDKFVNLVNDILRKLGIQQSLTKADIRRMLADARRYVEEGDTLYDNGTLRPAFSIENYMQQWQPTADQQKFKVLGWHGSPHVFNKFSTDAIGTGEGAQAFGWGLYFTEKEDIARYYADALSDPDIPENSDFIQSYLNGYVVVDENGDQWLASDLNDTDTYVYMDSDGDFSEWPLSEPTINEDNKRIPDASGGLTNLDVRYELNQDVPNSYNYQDILTAFSGLQKYDRIKSEYFEKNPNKSRNIYKVTIHNGKEPGEYNWLDWSEPLVGQESDIDGLLETYAERYDGTPILPVEIADEATGEDLYQYAIEQLGSPKAASYYLLKAGIDGIRYPANQGRSDGNNYVVFDGDAVTIDEHIRYKRMGTLDETDHQYKKRLDNLQRKYQDQFLALRRTQEGVVADGGVLTDASNTYQDETLAYGRIEDQQTKLQRDHVQPLLDEMNRLYEQEDVTYDDVRRFIYARHAPERNEYMYNEYLQKDPAQQELVEESNSDLKALSGMTDGESADIIKEFAEKGLTSEMQAVGDRIDAINQMVLDVSVSSGIMSGERYGTLKKRYDHYMPLRGFEDYMDVDSTLYSGDMKAEGRSSKAGDILSYALAMADTAIIKGEKNKVKQTMLEFVKQNFERQDLFSIRNVYFRPTGDIDPETGKEIWMPTYTKPSTEDVALGRVKRNLDHDNEQARWDQEGSPFDEGSMRVQVNGRPVVIEFKKPHIAAAFKNKGVHEVKGVMAVANKYMRYLRHTITQYSPEFGPRNLMRDAMTGAINLSIDLDTVTAAKIVNPSTMGKGMKALWRAYHKNDYSGEWGQAVRAFEENGAPSGYWELDEVQERTKNLKEIVENGGDDASLGGKAWYQTKKGIKRLGNWFDDYNRTLENVFRLSTFKHLTENEVTNPDTGKPFTAKQAANYAKNLTVNFNRKGTESNFIGSMFLFFNAAVQGIARQAQPFFSGNTRTRWRAAAMPVVLGATAYGMIELMRASLGQDEDDEYFYDKINEWTRMHNIILPNLASDDPEDYIKIPLPYGYNVYWAAGDVLNRFLYGQTDIPEAALEMASATVDAYNPIGTANASSFGVGTYKSFLPTVFKPGFELAFNENFAGSTIKPEPFPFAPKEPESQQYFPWISKWAKETSLYLNEVTGGDEVTSGVIDVSPEYLEYLAGYFGGGTATFLTGLVNTGTNTYDHITGQEEWEKTDMFEVPFGRSYYGVITDGPTRQEFYDNADQIDNLMHRYESYYDNGDVEKAQQLYARNKGIMLLEPRLKAIQKQMRSLRKMEKMWEARARDAEDKEIRNEAKNNADKVGDSIHQMHLEFNKMMNQAEENRTKNPADFLNSNTDEE